MNRESLEEISNALAQYMRNRDARVFTFVETGYDETGTAATVDGYLRLAKTLIDFVAAAQRGEGEMFSYGGVKGTSDISIGYVFSPISEVELDSLFLVQTEDEAERVTRYFQENSSAEQP